MNSKGNKATRQQGNKAATCRLSARPAWLPRGLVASSPAFTLIELLVVIVIIGVLAALLITVASHVSSSQKAGTTRNTMRLVSLAIDQFAEQDPLRSIYDNPKLRVRVAGNEVLVGRTFGPYPPYQLNLGTGTTVAGVLEPIRPNPYTLGRRLTVDLSGSANPPAEPNEWVDIQDGAESDPPEKKRNDDIRALYAYLAAYTPGVLSQIPDSAKKRLPERIDADKPEMINPTGEGTNPPGAGAVDVLGIYDAWGVPLDYFLQVKVEWTQPADGSTQRWVVTDRVPVLRSRAITKEEVEAEAAGTDALDPERWIFSVSFPRPAAGVLDLDKGTLPPNPGGPGANGWVRAVAAGDAYKYLPE